MEICLYFETLFSSFLFFILFSFLLFALPPVRACFLPSVIVTIFLFYCLSKGISLLSFISYFPGKV